MKVICPVVGWMVYDSKSKGHFVIGQVKLVDKKVWDDRREKRQEPRRYRHFRSRKEHFGGFK